MSMEKSRLFPIFIFFLSVSAHAAVEIGADFNYEKQVYGTTRQNSQRQRLYSASMAFYLFKLTGIELNYAVSKQIITENSETDIGSNLTITSIQNTIDSEVYGIGIRQALASRKATIMPMISVGFAQQITQTQTLYNVRDESSSATTTVLDLEPKRVDDSVFAVIALRVQLTKGLGIKGSVKTIFPAFETEQAQDNLKYTAGLSWIF